MTHKNTDRVLQNLNAVDFDIFRATCSKEASPTLYPLSAAIVRNIVIYDSTAITEGERASVMQEIQDVLLNGPGVFIVRGLIAKHIVDRAERVAENVKPIEALAGGAASRRTFAYSEKHAKHDPDSFADYYGNETLSTICEAWLGPGYQITATTNTTFKGGSQQAIHRDYHVSHQSLDRIHRIPVANQVASQFLTLQCAIAHTNMPSPTGPTCFLPFSQLFEKGYIAVREQCYIDYIKCHLVQLELEKGDAVFFNPLIFHQPGINTTGQERVANLLQVSSAFGRSMESCDRLGMTKSLWPVLKRWNQEVESGQRSQNQLDALIAATCSDYGYPKIFDRSVPGPETQADIVREALRNGTNDAVVVEALEQHQDWHQQ